MVHGSTGNIPALVLGDGFIVFILYFIAYEYKLNILVCFNITDKYKITSVFQ